MKRELQLHLQLAKRPRCQFFGDCSAGVTVDTACSEEESSDSEAADMCNSHAELASGPEVCWVVTVGASFIGIAKLDFVKNC